MNEGKKTNRNRTLNNFRNIRRSCLASCRHPLASTTAFRSCYARGYLCHEHAVERTDQINRGASTSKRATSRGYTGSLWEQLSKWTCDAVRRFLGVSVFAGYYSF